MEQDFIFEIEQKILLNIDTDTSERASEIVRRSVILFERYQCTLMKSVKLVSWSRRRPFIEK